MADGNAAPRQQGAHPSCVDKNEWMKLVLADETLTSATKTVAIRIALHHNSTTGQCDPGAETLSKGVNLTERAVQKAVAALRDAGFIEWTTPKGRRNVYTLKRINVWRAQESASAPTTPPNERSGAGTNAGSGVTDKPTNAGSGVGTNAGSGVVRTAVQGPPRTVVRTNTGRSNPGTNPGTTNPGAGGDEGGAGPADSYVFESGVIRLNDRDFSNWKAAYPNLNLAGELTAMAGWAKRLMSEGKDWFDILPMQLAKKDREAKQSRERSRIEAESRAKYMTEQAARSSRPAI